MTLHFPFENTYARLPDRFYARVAPTPVQAPRLIRLNTQLALDLGLDPNWLAGPQGLEVLAGRLVPDSAEPIADACQRVVGCVLHYFAVAWFVGTSKPGPGSLIAPPRNRVVPKGAPRPSETLGSAALCLFPLQPVT